MKKSLFAVAAMSAIAGTAQAQSSVTVYGIMDVGFIGTNQYISNNAAGTGLTANTNVRNTTGALTDSAEQTSRLGFKGVEDLGGGLSGFFTIETAITPNAQNAISSSTATANRQTFLGLKKNGVGEFAFGTQYTVVHNAVAATDPGQTNNIMGNVIYDKGAGATYTQTTTTGGAGSNQYSGMQNNTSYTVRANNMLTASTAQIAGFKGNAFYVYNNSNTNSATIAAASAGYTGGATNHTAWGLGVDYTWNKLFATANYQSFKDQAAFAQPVGAGAFTAGAPVINGYGGTSVAGTNVLDNQQYYAATYDFGILKAYAQYIGRKSSVLNNPNTYINRTAQQIGVRSYITPTIESWASAGTGKITVGQTYAQGAVLVSAGVAGATSANFGGFQLGSNYWLSKRTNLYAIYGQERTSTQSWNGPANGTTAYSSNNYAVGVRHTF